MFIFKLILAVAPFFLNNPSHASFYPPGYKIEQECKTNGPVQICTVNRHYSNYPRLEISYNGFLINDHWGKINVFVKLNGQTGLFKMTNENYNEKITLNDPRPYLCCAKVKNNPNATLPPGPFVWCKYTESDFPDYIVWEVSPIPQVEQDLFFWTRNNFGAANAWDIEVAFLSDDGNWDSLFGKNYHFRFN